MDPSQRMLPSERWTSFDDSNFVGRDGLTPGSIDLDVLTKHASAVLGSPAVLSERFCDDEWWCCFELVAPDGRFLIARVLIPSVNEDDEISVVDKDEVSSMDGNGTTTTDGDKTAIVEQDEKAIEDSDNAANADGDETSAADEDENAIRDRDETTVADKDETDNADIEENPHADDDYTFQNEVATMKFLRANVKTVRFPELLAYEPRGSERAEKLGAPYMLLEGIYGKTLQDTEENIYDLPISTQEHVFTQWTSLQAELASFTFPQIGSISDFSPETGATIGPIARFPSTEAGPFDSNRDYFEAVLDTVLDRIDKKYASDYDWDDGSYGANFDPALVSRSARFAFIACVIFSDLLQDTGPFPEDKGPFHFNLMDVGMQNMLVDEEFNVVAVVDWNMDMGLRNIDVAGNGEDDDDYNLVTRMDSKTPQSAPWEAITFPIGLSLEPTVAQEDVLDLLHDTDHPSHRKMARQFVAGLLYEETLHDAEVALEKERGAALKCSLADTLVKNSSMIYSLVERIGVIDGVEEDIVRQMLWQGYGLQGKEADERIKVLMEEMEQAMIEDAAEQGMIKKGEAEEAEEGDSGSAEAEEKGPKGVAGRGLLRGFGSRGK